MEKLVERIKKHPVIFIFLLLFLSSTVQMARQLPGNYNSSTYFFLAIYLIIIRHLGKNFISNRKPGLNIIHIVLLSCLLYMAVGAGVAGYTGEGSIVADFQEGQEIEYSISYSNDLKIPFYIDKVIPLSKRDMEVISISTRSPQKSHKSEVEINIKLKIKSETALYPERVVIFYRALGIIPLINITDLMWPNYLND